jgi:MSHA biogenesis protein MshG
MSLFYYRAIKADGGDAAGTFEAATSQEVETWLLRQGQHPVLIRIAETAGKNEAKKLVAPRFWQKLKGISIDDRILFCRQVATMLGAGVAILQALRIMSRQASNPAITTILTDVANRIEDGANLSDSFAVYPRFTSSLFFNIVRVGEETGTLDKSFEYLSELYENEKEVNERIKAATRYPKIVISAILAAVLFLMSFVVPKFMTMFKNAKVELPLPTKMLIAISNFATAYFWFIVFFVVLLGIGYRLAMRYDSLRMLRDRLWLKVPIFGILSLKIFMSRFGRVFSLLLKSGVNVIRTLELSATALENLVLFEMLDKVTGDVREGVEMHQAMAKHALFPDMIVQMVAVGEEAGQVDTMMARVADYYEKETGYMIKNLSTMIEPLLLLVMGVMVGFLALAIYMPMWNMMKVMKG